MPSAYLLPRSQRSSGSANRYQMLCNKKIQAAQRTLTNPCHSGPLSHEALELLNNLDCCFEMLRRATLFDAYFRRFKLPTNMVVYLRKTEIMKPGRESADMKVDILPTQQRLIKQAKPN